VRAIVVGAGVVGLTTAVRLREAGVDADVVAREDPLDTTSAVAAALWYPYRALPVERVTAWSAATYDALAALADVAGSGVRMRAGTELLAPDAPDPWWRDAVPGLARTPEGLRFVAPAVDMSIHLPWLVGRLRALGGAIERRAVAALDELEADAVVNCAGLGARELAGDGSLTAVRGQVVRVTAPDVDEWLLDQSDPQRLVYVVPRERDVALVPALRDAPVVGVAVGLRPVRPTVRLEAEGRVVHCYGHGGAGVTLAWGCAGEVAALLAGGGGRYPAPR
jgi:D-amino-acid oxidase